MDNKKYGLKRFNHFIYGFIPGIIMPFLFIWIYLSRLYPGYDGILNSLKQLFPGVLFGKLLIISILPNLMFVFLFYKTDSFKIATGLMVSGILYLMVSMFML